MNIYDIDLFDPVECDLEAYQNTYTLAPELWGKFKIDDLVNVDFSKWESIKLLKNGAFSDELSKISSRYGGIYVYCIEPHIIPSCGCYVMYIGKATKTQSENLKVRVQSYHKFIDDSVSRPRLHRLFAKWGDYVYVHYLSIDANADIITALEDRLIGAFGKPPCNAEVRAKSVKLAVRAFN